MEKGALEAQRTLQPDSSRQRKSGSSAAERGVDVKNVLLSIPSATGCAHSRVGEQRSLDKPRLI